MSLRGLPLETEIARSRHEDNGIAIYYLGQVGFLLQHRGLTVAIDPFLSDSVDQLEGCPPGFWRRNYPPPCDPAKLNGVDLVLCTHDHLDHTDPETLRAIATASPACRFAAPRLSAREIVRAGIDPTRVVELNEGRPFRHGSLEVDPIAAAHEDYETDAQGWHRWLGYRLRWGGIQLFHAGDTVFTPRLEETLARHPIDVAFLPINGGDAERRGQGIVGNMTAEDAVALAARLRVDLLVPTHYELYSNNGARLANLVSAWEETPFLQRPKFKAFLPGERMIYRKSDRERKLAVVIGAGKTGRGFLARLLEDSDHTVVLIDRSRELVDRLKEDGGYAIHFFGGERPPYHVGAVAVALAGSMEALDWMSRASIVFTAVGESNIAGLIPELTEALDRRRATATSPLRVLVCENGVAPAEPLRKAFAHRSAEIEVGEAAIFCSTIELPGTRLDIQSEPYDELPFDAARLPGFQLFAGLQPVSDFPTLLKRKIYTYNCFSACIAYLGAYKGYQWYADAAGDSEIGEVLDRVAAPLNEAISHEFGTPIEEQTAFSEAALRKFRDQNIRDDIARNARNVVRKLGPDDRLIAPARLIAARGGSVDALAHVMAAALLYHGPDEAALQARLRAEPVETVFAGISGCPPESPLVRSVASHYARLRQSKDS